MEGVIAMGLIVRQTHVRREDVRNVHRCPTGDGAGSMEAAVDAHGARWR